MVLSWYRDELDYLCPQHTPWSVWGREQQGQTIRCNGAMIEDCTVEKTGPWSRESEEVSEEKTFELSVKSFFQVTKRQQVRRSLFCGFIMKYCPYVMSDASGHCFVLHVSEHHTFTFPSIWNSPFSQEVTMVSSFCFGKEKVEEAHGISSGRKYRFLEIKWSIRSRPKVFELFCSKAFGNWKPKHLSHLGWEEKSFWGSCT